MGKDTQGTPCDLTVHSFNLVHGNWGSWSSWDPCSVSCGVGETGRRRFCDNPAPLNGGLYCGGESFKIRLCENEECPQQEPGNGGNFGQANSSDIGRINTITVGSKTGVKFCLCECHYHKGAFKLTKT